MRSDAHPANARNALGHRGEEAAAVYLTGLGFLVLERRFACRRGEIDIIAREGDCLCFVEVRTRRPGPVRPFETVGSRKQRRLVFAAVKYLSDHGIALVGQCALRFDVVEVNVQLDGSLSLELCRNAFEADF